MTGTCESCQRRPAAVVIDPDGARFLVCGACALVDVVPAAPFVPALVVSR